VVGKISQNTVGIDSAIDSVETIKKKAISVSFSSYPPPPTIKVVF